MANRERVKPTTAELGILRVIWERGPSTVREVHEVVGEPRGTSYTTTLKLMQIMHQKGLLCRDSSSRPHVYEPANPQTQTQRHLVNDLIERAFGGSASKLVLHALSAKRASSQELEEIRRLLDDIERGG